MRWHVDERQLLIIFDVTLNTAPGPSALLATQHGEIIESSYLLGEKGPKSTWTKVLEMVILLATVGGCAYLFLFLFHHGNHRPAAAKDSASHPHTPVGASSSSSHGPASCLNYPKCAELGELGRLTLVPVGQASCSRWSGRAVQLPWPWALGLSAFLQQLLK